MPGLCRASRYNHAFPYKGEMLLFNGLSSALTVLPCPVFEWVESYLFAAQPFDPESVGDPGLRTTLEGLRSGRFFLDADTDEVRYLRRRSELHKTKHPMSLTVATTMDCNLGCYYCFEEKYKSYMDDETCDLIYEYARREMEKETPGTLYVTWFGGEPMLNPGAIERLSAKLIALCAARGVKYAGNMISNGTTWPETAEEIRAFVLRNRIMHVQFTFDGLPHNHNKRRRYVSPGAELSSFDAMARTISALVGATRMTFRMNCDPDSVKDLFGLVDLFVERGWLYPGSGTYPYAARIRPATETCDFVQNHMVEYSEFNQLNNRFLRYVAQFMDAREIAELIYPKAVKVGCDAVNPRGMMFGPDGMLYRCTEDMGDHKRSHGHIREKLRMMDAAKLLPILGNGFANAGSLVNDYENFDPHSQSACSVCKYLPQCMSGCPKDQLEKQRRANENRANTDAFKQYWDDSLGPLITMYADLTIGREGQSAPSEAQASFDEYLANMRQESVRVGMS